MRKAHNTRKSRPKLAKAIEEVRAGSIRYPYSERAKDRLAELEQIYRNCEDEWQGAKTEFTLAKATLSHHIEDYVKPSSLTLCERILTRLPREVRDHVLEFVFILVWKERRQSWPRGGCNEYANEELHERSWDVDDILPIHRLSCPGYQRTAPSHLWDSDFVGPVVRKEMVEAFFRISRFYLVLMCNHLPSIEDHLNDDLWNTGTRPFDYVSKVVFKHDWRGHLGHAKKFRRNTQFTALLEMDRFFVYNQAGTVANYAKHMDELVKLARDVRGAGYRVRVFVEKEEVDLDEEIEVVAVEGWVKMYQERFQREWDAERARR